MWREPRPTYAHILFFEIEVAAGGQHHAVLAQDEGAVEHAKRAEPGTLPGLNMLRSSSE